MSDQEKPQDPIEPVTPAAEEVATDATTNEPAAEPAAAEEPQEGLAILDRETNTVVSKLEGGLAARGYAIMEGRGPVVYNGVTYTNENLTHRIVLEILRLAPHKFTNVIGRGMYALDDPYWEKALEKTGDVLADAQTAQTAVVKLAMPAQVPCVNCPK